MTSVFEGTRYTYVHSRVGGGDKLKIAYVIRKIYELSFNSLDATLDLFLLNKKEFPH